MPQFTGDTPAHWPAHPLFIAEITSAGPNGEDDFDGNGAYAEDNVYWARELYSQATTGDATGGADLAAFTGGRHVPAEHLQGTSGTHDISLIGERVPVYVVRDRRGVRRYCFPFSQAAASVSWTTLTDVARITTGTFTGYAGGNDDFLEVSAANVTVAEARWLWRLPSPPVDAAAIRGVYFECAGNPLARVGLIDLGSPAAAGLVGQLRMGIYPITADFDTGTVAWGTQPTVGTVQPRSPDVLSSAGGYDTTGTPTLEAGLRYNWSFVDFSGLWTTGTDVYGIEVRADLLASTAGVIRWAGFFDAAVVKAILP